MPADALPVPHGSAPASLVAGAIPVGLSTFTLTGGAYTDPTGAVKFAGLTGLLSLTAPLRYNGAEVDGTVTVTIANDGTFSVGPLANTSDPAVAAQGVAYRMDWQVGRFADCPGGQRSVTFTVAAGVSTADYDAIVPRAATTPAPPGLDALVAALINDRSSATAAALNHPLYPYGG